MAKTALKVEEESEGHNVGEEENNGCWQLATYSMAKGAKKRGRQGARMNSTQPILKREEEEDAERRWDEKRGVREQNVISVEEEDKF